MVTDTDHVGGFAPDLTARKRHSGTGLPEPAPFETLLRGHSG